ncbi:hypothetical protein FL966_12315 [Caproiciproducens galactitolivorans]|uniref:Uncharacterized protein n=1 Tax=Caproiciproducens galactitolivorans TaxID=642589 RepID=A0A4Z0Y0W8_9FIRM|nr:hypothetical protein [Caproiciproducens galactitolivorans]QEY35784.1 hypothetical protein FL966_12315 [Caproiciproducens galactitolivorans]TGJ77519.1 hypothetical protein CAGA_08910 [Caproiciproducens galactitolivorans]
MLYCSKCQLLVNDKMQRCPVCSSKKLRTLEQDDPVLLMTASEEKAGMIRAAFREKGVVFEERNCGIGGPPAAIVGKPSNTDINFFVRYGELHACEDILRGIGILDASDAELQKPANKTDRTDNSDSTPEEAPVEMSAGKRFFIRAVSAIVFIFLVWGVVAFADWAAEALKAFFTR